MAVNVHYNEGYTTMCNHHLRDVSLSWQAKGMLSFMFSNREDFKYSINGLIKCASNGDTSVRSILNELKDKGYLIVTPIKGNNGKIECWDYDFFETPDDAKQFVGRPHVENTHVENTHVENQGQRNTNISSTKKINTNNNTPYIPQGGLESELSRSELIFEEFRKFYKGTKRGLKTEFENFKKKHKDWKEVLPTLLEKYKAQQEAKEKNKQNGGFVPQEKNLQTYLNQRCWEEEINTTNELAKYGTINEESQSDKPHSRLVQKMEEWCDENLSGMF